MFHGTFTRMIYIIFRNIGILITKYKNPHGIVRLQRYLTIFKNYKVKEYLPWQQLTAKCCCNNATVVNKEYSSC